MSDALKHECGIALLDFLKPLEFYKEKYGTAFYGINKMYLMMEKQHNRGKMVLVLQVLNWNATRRALHKSCTVICTTAIQDIFAQD